MSLLHDQCVQKQLISPKFAKSSSVTNPQRDRRTNMRSSGYQARRSENSSSPGQCGLKHVAFLPQIFTYFGPRKTHRPTLSPRRSRSFSTVRCARVNPTEVLNSDQLREWNEVSALVQKIDPALAVADAEKLVGRAFGWGSQKFWRGDVKQEPPSMQSAENALDFLRETVSLDDESIAKVVKSFPEVLRLTVTRMQENINYIQRTYPSIKGKLLVNTVKGTPAVLGYDYDCEGDCQSECARCWVQF